MDEEKIFQQKTSTFVPRKKQVPVSFEKAAKLFVCNHNEIMEFDLSGHQTVGRPDGNHVPDIPILNDYISRRHGFFDTNDDRIQYTVQKTTNNVYLRGKPLKTDTVVTLTDRDELVIPTHTESGVSNVILTVATERNHIQIWQNLIKSSRDNLTGLLGRNSFNTWLVKKIFEMSPRLSMCLFILDIDSFKQINDRYGHLTGDLVLRMISDTLNESILPGGTVCRWGGDEFVGAFTGRSSILKSKIEALKDKIASTAFEGDLHITVSIGYLIFRKNQIESVDNVIRAVDTALYQAKQTGKNKAIAFDFPDAE